MIRFLLFRLGRFSIISGTVAIFSAVFNVFWKSDDPFYSCFVLGGFRSFLEIG